MQRSAKALTSLRIPYKAILTASTETRREVFFNSCPMARKQSNTERVSPKSLTVKRNEGTTNTERINAMPILDDYSGEILLRRLFSLIEGESGEISMRG